MSQIETINISVNGQSKSIQATSTVTQLLQILNITPKYVVVQLDGNIVPRDHFAETILNDGCQLEIITLVGGG